MGQLLFRLMEIIIFPGDYRYIQRIRTLKTSRAQFQSHLCHLLAEQVSASPSASYLICTVGLTVSPTSVVPAQINGIDALVRPFVAIILIKLRVGVLISREMQVRIPILYRIRISSMWYLFLKRKKEKESEADTAKC